MEPRPPSEPRPTLPSDRLQLEIALFRTPSEPAAKGAREESLGEPGYRVLLFLADPDLSEYVRECLRERTEVRVFELGAPGETRSEALRRVRPDLIIADTSLVSTRNHELEQSAVPLLLIGQETPEHLTGSDTSSGQSPARPIEVLLDPFNARRLVEAVERFGMLDWP